MAEVGNLGELITFSVSPEKVLTFNKFNRQIKSRWATHDVISGKPLSEFIGQGQQTLSFDIYLTVMNGVTPKKVIEEIETAVEIGTPLTFVVGGRKIGQNQWVIDSVSEAWDAVIDQGLLVACNLSLSLSEYV